MELIGLILAYSCAATACAPLIGHRGRYFMCSGWLFALGAYSTAIPAFVGIRFAWGGLFIVAVTTGAVVCAITSRRTSQDFALATLALQIAGTVALRNLSAVTNGGTGLSANVDLKVGVIVGSLLFLWCLLMALNVWIATSAMGTILRVAEEREISFVPDLDRDRQDRRASSLLGFTAAIGLWLSGALFASLVGFVDPGQYDLDFSIQVLAAVLLGGKRALLGPTLGAVLLVGGGEVLRWIGGDLGAISRTIVAGAIVLAIMLLRPQGLLRGYLRKGLRQYEDKVNPAERCSDPI